MKIIEHFSAYTQTPVVIDDIADFILEKGYVDAISFVENDEDGEVLGGMLYHMEYDAPYAKRSIAWVIYNSDLTDQLIRLVCAKELLHIVDSEKASASDQISVDKLLSEMVIPPELLRDMAAIGIETISDHAGLLRALMVLFPWETRELFLKPYKEQKIGLAQIVTAVDVPIEYAALVMSDGWAEIYNAMLEVSKSHCRVD